MLAVSFNPKEFAIGDLSPEDTSFTVVDFVHNVILPLADRYVRQLREVGRHKLQLHFDNSKCHIAQHVQEQMASHRCVCVPHSRIYPT
jgi:hypothetical protein